jgi:beta-galactosidase
MSINKPLVILLGITFFSCSQMKLQNDYLVSGVKNPVICLSGTWQFSENPAANFWEINSDTSGWKNILVPGEPMMQGFKIDQDKEYAYKKWVEVPFDFSDKKITIHFEAIYSYARVWVNGKFICDHYCGFTPWDCDITDFVKPNEKCLLVVGFTDIKKDISKGSTYAQHHIGGILRDVSLIAIPKNHIAQFHYTVDFDEQYKGAVLKITGNLKFADASSALVRISLFDQNGDHFASSSDQTIKKENPDINLNIPVISPLKWDEEHPNLYTLKAELLIDDKVVEAVNYKVGFREIEVRKNKFLVNGQEIKLRGMNHHMIHPLLGRADDDAYAERDVQLCKEANVNFIRTSHYPPSKKFLDMCDKYGLYVESESAVCFQDSSTNDSSLTSMFLTRLNEMIEHGRNHPSVIIWSLGNESTYGFNCMKCYKFCKKSDPTRPVLFSFLTTKTPKCYDLFDIHYNSYKNGININDSTLSGFGSDTMPRFQEEYASIATYSYSLYKSDLSIRDFYGPNLDTFWCQIYDIKGCLGGAVWAMIDENFLLKDTAVGYGNWGMIDIWRRKKPEFWNVKKAYSPIRVITKIIDPKSPKSIKVYNRFNHSSFNELLCRWNILDEKGTFKLPDAKPHEYADIPLPKRNWTNGEKFLIQFFRDTLMIDEEQIPVGEEKHLFAEGKKTKLKVKEDSKNITVSSENMSLKFDKLKGLMTSGLYKGKKIIESGPYIYFGPYYKFKEWKPSGIKCIQSPDTVIIIIDGKAISYGDDWIKSGWTLWARKFNFTNKLRITDVQFIIKISTSGTIVTTYTVKSSPPYTEVGVRYVLSSEIEKYCWERKGFWSTYPDDQIGRLKGECAKSCPNKQEYLKAPVQPWKDDLFDFYSTGPFLKDYYVNACEEIMKNVSFDFKSMKQNIWFASFILSNDTKRLRIMSDADVSVRSEITNADLWNLYIINKWSYMKYNHYNESGQEWVNLENEFTLPANYSASAKMCFTESDN